MVNQYTTTLMLLFGLLMAVVFATSVVMQFNLVTRLPAIPLLNFLSLNFQFTDEETTDESNEPTPAAAPAGAVNGSTTTSVEPLSAFPVVQVPAHPRNPFTAPSENL